jgi:hypothetical protein
VTLPAFVILVLLVFVAAVIFLELAAIPGKQARERGHPQADAINILGWIGLLLGFAPWVFALVWAYTKPGILGPDPSGQRLAAPSPAPEPAQHRDD